MEGKFDPKTPNLPQPKMENPFRDVFLFRELLSRSRSKIDKTKTQIARDLGFNKNTVNSWEDGTSFPGEDKLQALANAYQISLGELQATLAISREARDKAGEYRKNPKSTSKAATQPDFPTSTGHQTSNRKIRNR